MRRLPMLYQRSKEIEDRLRTVLRLIESGKYSTPMLARELGVSIPTISRDVTALRERGHAISALRQSDGTWRYFAGPTLAVERVGGKQSTGNGQKRNQRRNSTKSGTAR
jgi:biotin operon repressor